MKLSVIIVNYNVAYFLEQCLQSVSTAVKGIDAEVFVVDNSSVDNSVEMVQQKFPWVQLIANKDNLGFAKANNQAIRSAQGEYILLLNPDTVVEADTFRLTLDFMDAHPQAGGLGVKMVDGKGTFLPESKRSLPVPDVAFYKIFGLSKIFKKSKKFGKYHLTYLNENDINEVEVLSGAFMMLRKNVLDKIGLLDEDYFMYGEDIDLSYRITQAGYKNYYFPLTRIIHYKGESTKKSSINYVILFYKAMQIFAQKHFSHKNASLFNCLINIAIWLRASLAIIQRIAARILLPLIDFILIYGGILGIAFYWQNHILWQRDSSFSSLFLYIILPLYALIWICSIYFSSGYKKPLSTHKLHKGVVIGTVVILLGYALLGENWRFSRAVIVLGTCWTFISTHFLRYIIGKMNLASCPVANINHSKRILIAGDYEEVKRISLILGMTNQAYEFIGYVYHLPQPKPHKDFIGNIGQLKDIVNIYHIGEIIFCGKNFTAKEIINWMENTKDFGLEYKIAPEESSFIIGSNTINAYGGFHSMNFNSIGKKENIRNKRLSDITISLLLLITYPFNMWWVHNKKMYFRNICLCLKGTKTWMGYYPMENDNDTILPKLPKSVLYTTDLFQLETHNQDIISQINNLYAGNYSVRHDIRAIFTAFEHLGR
ncbi:MAG: glycosyltransferase [Bacteroidales bacterium]|nr:glycosyltransferase [Bacteroidales bacterium]